MATNDYISNWFVMVFSVSTLQANDLDRVLQYYRPKAQDDYDCGVTNSRELSNDIELGL